MTQQVLAPRFSGETQAPGITEPITLEFAPSALPMDDADRIVAILPVGFNVAAPGTPLFGGAFAPGTTCDAPVITGQQISVTLRGTGTLLAAGERGTVTFPAIGTPAVARVYPRAEFQVRTNHDPVWQTADVDVPLGTYAKAVQHLLEADA